LITLLQGARLSKVLNDPCQLVTIISKIMEGISFNFYISKFSFFFPYKKKHVTNRNNIDTKQIIIVNLTDDGV
jgi:hypothetical protein